MNRGEDSYDDYGGADIPFSHKKEKSKYASMSKTDKMKMTMKRIEEDRLRARQQLPLLKKKEIKDKRKLFVTKKRVYDLSSGYALCVTKIPDKEAYFYGLSNGTVIYFDVETEKINTAVRGDGYPVLDILALNGDKFVTVDDFSQVKVYNDYELEKCITNYCAFVANTYNYGKVLVGNDNYLFFINSTNDGVIKINLTDYSVETLNLNRGKLYQLQLIDQKLFAISEEGYIVMAEMLDTMAMTADEHEALPGGLEITEMKIEDISNEEMGIALKTHKQEALEASLLLESESIVLNNSDVQETGQQNDNALDENDHPDDFDQEISQSRILKTSMKESRMGASSYDRMEKVFNIPVKSLFFRTIAVSIHYIAVCAHDGQGNNIIYLYNHKLQLKAFKFLRIEKNDYGFNLSKYIHKLEIVQRKEGIWIYGVTHKREMKLFVLKYHEEKLKLFKKYKAIHNKMVTDLRADGDTIITSGQDKRVSIYNIDYRYDFK